MLFSVIQCFCHVITCCSMFYHVIPFYSMFFIALNHILLILDPPESHPGWWHDGRPRWRWQHPRGQEKGCWGLGQQNAGETKEEGSRWVARPGVSPIYSYSWVYKYDIWIYIYDVISRYLHFVYWIGWSLLMILLLLWSCLFYLLVYTVFYGPLGIGHVWVLQLQTETVLKTEERR